MVNLNRSEDYLKAIYLLREKNGQVRIKDLSEMLGVKPSTVVDYLKKLSRNGLVIYKKRGIIDLTPKGIEIAKGIYYKHSIVKEFLCKVLGVPEEIADKDACYIEHGIHNETLNKMKLVLKLNLDSSTD